MKSYGDFFKKGCHDSQHLVLYIVWSTYVLDKILLGEMTLKSVL